MKPLLAGACLALLLAVLSSAQNLKDLSKPCNQKVFDVTGFQSVGCDMYATCCNNGRKVESILGIASTCTLPFSLSAAGTFKSASVRVDVKGNGTYSGGPFVGKPFSLIGSDEEFCDGTSKVVTPIGLRNPC